MGGSPRWDTGMSQHPSQGLLPIRWVMSSMSWATWCCPLAMRVSSNTGCCRLRWMGVSSLGHSHPVGCSCSSSWGGYWGGDPTAPHKPSPYGCAHHHVPGECWLSPWAAPQHPEMSPQCLISTPRCWGKRLRKSLRQRARLGVGKGSGGENPICHGGLTGLGLPQNEDERLSRGG